MLNTTEHFPAPAPETQSPRRVSGSVLAGLLLPKRQLWADKRLLFVSYLFITPLPGRPGCFPDDVTHAITVPTHLLRSRVLTWPVKCSHQGISVLPPLLNQHHGIKCSLPEPRPAAAHRSPSGMLPWLLSPPSCSRAPCFSLIKSTAVLEPQPANERKARAVQAREAVSFSSHCQHQIKIALGSYTWAGRILVSDVKIQVQQRSRGQKGQENGTFSWGTHRESYPNEFPAAGGTAHGWGYKSRQSQGSPQPSHGCSRMGSHSNVSHKLKFSLDMTHTRKDPRELFLGQTSFFRWKKKERVSRN